MAQPHPKETEFDPVNSRTILDCWGTVRLGDESLFQILSGGTPSTKRSELWNGGVQWITLADLPKGNLVTFIQSTERTISELGLSQSAARIVPVDSIVISTRATIGRIGINRVELATNQGFKTVVPLDRSRVSTKFVAYYMTQKVSELQAMASGATYGDVSKSSLSEMLVPLPPLPDQRRIVKAIELRFETIEKARRAIRWQLKSIGALPLAHLRAVFPERGQRMPVGWRRETLGNMCLPVESVNPKREPESGFRYVEISSIDRRLKRINATKNVRGANAPSRARQRIHENDVLVSTTRPNLNAVALVPKCLDDQLGSTGFCVLRPTRGLLPQFLFRFVQTEGFVNELTSLATGTSYPAVTDEQVKSLSIPLPSLGEQQRIVNEVEGRFAAVDAVMEACLAQQDAIDRLSNAYLRQAFAGGL